MTSSASLPMYNLPEMRPVNAQFWEALRGLAHNPCYAKARRGLLVTDIIDVPAAAYRGLLDYEREAAELGYPALA